MDITSALKNLSAHKVQNILKFWEMTRPTFLPSRKNEIKAALDNEKTMCRTIAYIQERMLDEKIFLATFSKLNKKEKGMVLFLVIHGGDMLKEEVLTRLSPSGKSSHHRSPHTATQEKHGRTGDAQESLLEILSSKGFIFEEHAWIPFLSETPKREPPPSAKQDELQVIVGVPDQFVNFIQLPPHLDGFLGRLLKNVAQEHLITIARTLFSENDRITQEQITLIKKDVARHLLIVAMRHTLLSPSKLRRYISTLSENEKEIFRGVVRLKGICIYRELLDSGYQKHYDHSKADYINGLVSSSGLLFTAIANKNKYNNLLVLPRDVHYTVTHNFRSDTRSFQQIDHVRLKSSETTPSIMLDNSNSLLRDLVVFTNYLNRNVVKTLSNGGMGKNDLKKILPFLSPHKTIKYAAFLALFCIVKKFIIGVSGSWHVAPTFFKWLEHSQLCYEDIFRFWIETNNWNEEYVDGNVLHAETFPTSLINITELRKIVLTNLKKFAWVSSPKATRGDKSDWINFSSFVESLMPQIEVHIPKRAGHGAAEKYNRDNYLVLESVISECLFWLGLVSLGISQVTMLDKLGNRSSEFSGMYVKRGKKDKKEREIKFFFKLTSLGKYILSQNFLEPGGLFENRKRAKTQPLRHDVQEFIVQPNLDVIVPPDLNLRSFYNLNEFCDIQSIDVMSTLTISKESLREGLDKGLRGEDILKFLEENCAQGLPDTVRHLINECSAKHGAVNMGFAGGYLLVDDPILLAELKSQKTFREAIKDIIDNRIVLLNPNVDVKKMAKDLQRLGFMPQLDSESVYITSEGKFHLSLTKEDLYFLMAALKFILYIEEGLTENITEDKVVPLLERLRPSTRNHYNLNHFAETISQGFFKKYQSVTSKRLNDAISGYKKQVARLLSSSTRAPARYVFPGPNPATKPPDIRTMIQFALEHETEMRIKYLKGSSRKVEEVIEPESLDKKGLYAYSREKEAYGVYNIDKIRESELL